jgi:hypothetical protein
MASKGAQPIFFYKYYVFRGHPTSFFWLNAEKRGLFFSIFLE